MACSADPAENLAKAEWRIREAAGKGAQIVCLQELFRFPYFCREENADRFDLAEPIPGPTTESLSRLADELNIVDRRLRLRAPHGRGVSQYRRGDRCRRRAARHLPQDAHSRRSAVLRKILLHARRPGLPLLRDALRAHRPAGLLGPMVSRSGAPGRLGRRAGAFLPHGHRLASGREGAARRGAARCLAHRAARPCHRQRSLCGRGQSRGV